jgi:hypothetical protein
VEYPAAVLVGTIAAFWLLRAVLPAEYRQDVRWVVIVIGAVALSAVVGTVLWSLIS